MKSTPLRLLLVAALSGGMALSASATLILSPLSASNAASGELGYLLPPGILSGNDDAGEVETDLGLAPGTLTTLWKDDGTEDPDLLGISLSFPSGGSLGSTADVDIVVDNPPVNDLTYSYLILKSGSSYVIYDISGWDGIMDIQTNGFDGDGVLGGNGANGIQSTSHITIYGGGSNIPDGGATVALLGVSLLGFAGARRLKRFRKA